MSVIQLEHKEQKSRYSQSKRDFGLKQDIVNLSFFPHVTIEFRLRQFHLTGIALVISVDAGDLCFYSVVMR